MADLVRTCVTGRARDLVLDAGGSPVLRYGMCLRNDCDRFRGLKEAR